MMIEFENKLPCMRVGERRNGTYNNTEAGFPGIFTTLDSRLGEFMHGLRNEITNNRRLVFIDGRILMCDINWIRDHVHIMKGFLHWEHDLRSFLDFILENQSEEGFFYELIKQYDDYHWKFVNPDCYKMYPEDNMALVRLEIEADVEYLVVEGVRQVFRVTGDEEWLAWALPKLEKAITYMVTSPKRWDKEHGLVKRAFTIDTWDFTYGKSGDNRRIEPDTPMSIMHGDNSGVYQAMMQLAWMNRRLGKAEQAVRWESQAECLRENMFRYLWNGKFFIHQLHLNHKGADELEGCRLSLSNPYDINRGVTSTEQSRLIIEEYMGRRESTGMFAEWFSIDPPYEDFNGCQPGRYVNGAICPYAAGELAKAAFSNGYEEYGWDILKRFMEMYERDKAVYFLYSPYDREPQNKQGPSAWGAASLLNAIEEGLAGIEDLDCGYRILGFSPRFPVTEYTELRFVTGYEKTGKKVDVRYILKEKGMRYDITYPGEQIRAHILLPKGKVCKRVLMDMQDTDFSESRIGDSVYVDLVIQKKEKASIQVLFYGCSD